MVASTGAPFRSAATTAMWPTSPVRPVESSGMMVYVVETSLRLMKSCRCSSTNVLNEVKLKSTPLPLG